MPLTFLGLQGCDQVTDLTPLRGMPLTRLSLQQCYSVTSLTPLRDTKLTSLWLPHCSQVTDLTPLQNLPLTDLDIATCWGIKDLTPLKGLNLQTFRFHPHCIETGIEALRSMPSLRTIRICDKNAKIPDKKLTAAEFWKKYDAGEFK